MKNAPWAEDGTPSLHTCWRSSSWDTEGAVEYSKRMKIAICSGTQAWGAERRLLQVQKNLIRGRKVAEEHHMYLGRR